IYPDILFRVAGRGGSSGQRAGDLVHTHSQLGRPHAVHFYIDRGILIRLSQLNIPQIGYLLQLSDELLCVEFVVLLVTSGEPHFHRGRGSLAQDLMCQLDGLEGKFDIGHPVSYLRPDLLFQRIQVSFIILVQRNLENSFLGTGHPQIDRVHGEQRRVLTDIGGGNVDVLRTDDILDNIDGGEGLFFRAFDPGPFGRPESYLELASIHFRQYVFADMHEKKKGRAGSEDQVSQDDGFAKRHHAIDEAQEAVAQLIETARLPSLSMGLLQHSLLVFCAIGGKGGMYECRRFLMHFHDPVGHDRYKGLCEEIRNDHAEPDGKSQGQKEGARNTSHGEGRGEHGEDTEEDEQFRKSDLFTS